MIDTKIHENNQLLSMKGVDYTYQSKRYMFRLLNRLAKFSDYVFIHVKRNNYDDPSIDKLRRDKESLSIKGLKIEPSLFEISFNFHSSESKKELLLILVDLWFCFEQPAYYFVLNDGEFTNKNFLNDGLRWDQIVALCSSYFMFKSAEEDVIWLGKSASLEFDSIIEK